MLNPRAANSVEILARTPNLFSTITEMVRRIMPLVVTVPSRYF